MTWQDWLIVTMPQIITAAGAILGAYWARGAHKAVTGDVTPATERIEATIKDDVRPALAHVSDAVDANGGGSPPVA